MENKIVDFVREFNSQLEGVNQYCNLEYVDNGFVKAIKFPQIFLFDDDNENSEYIEERSLSHLVKTLNEVLEVAKEQLAFKVIEFFAENRKQVKEKFSDAKVHFTNKDSLKYTIFVSGNYNEDTMEDFLEDVKRDFEYIFEGLTLNIE